MNSTVDYCDYSDMVIDGVKEFRMDKNGRMVENKLDSILLNGTHVAVLIPGGIDEEGDSG